MLDETDSAGWVAASRIVTLLPFVIFGALGGLIADRFARNSVMIVSDLLQAAAMFGLAIVAAFVPSVAVAVALAFLCTTAGTAYRPAVAAITPEIVEEGQLASANAVISTIENIAFTLGPAFGGVLLLLGSAPIAFAVNGTSFVVSAILVTRIKSRSEGARARETSSTREHIIEGVRAITRSTDVAVLVIVMVAPTLFYGMESVLLVFVSDELLGTGTEGVGFLLAAAGLGGLVGAAASGRLARTPHPGRVLTGSLAVIGCSLLGLAFTSEPLIAYAFMTLDGMGTVVLDVVSVTLLQRALAREVVARVFGLIDAVSVAILLVGTALAPLLVEGLSLRGALVGAGAVLPVVAVFTMRRLGSLDSRSVAILEEIEPKVEILENTAIFEGASRPALEAIASSAVVIEVPSRADVLREGAAADDLYVILSGTLTVFSAEGSDREIVVNTLEAGDHFGEIGLLEGIPRTATVRAATACRLLRIPGEVFLDSVMRIGPVAERVRTGAMLRLAQTHPSLVGRDRDQ